MKEKVKDTKSHKLPKVEDKAALAKVSSVKKEMEAYFKKHKLDPTKDYTKDAKHGPVISKWTSILEVNRKKIIDSTPKEIPHSRNEERKKERAEKKYSEDKKPKALKAKELPKDSRQVTKYDYPLIDGKEMTSDEKKKYRIQARKGLPKVTKEVIAKDKPIKEKSKDKEKKVEKTPEKEIAKDSKDKKKKKKSKDKGKKKND